MVRQAGISCGIADAIRRGHLHESWYLVDVEAGFELWQGGAALTTKSFSVRVGGGPPSPGPRVLDGSTPGRGPRTDWRADGAGDPETRDAPLPLAGRDR
jgi:hypothetical protein